MSKKYYLGLDIGTNSVGWAVTDENYNLCKYAGKRMWGIRLFEGGETAEQRRISRSNRRKTDGFPERNRELICYRSYLQKKLQKWTLHFLFD